MTSATSITRSVSSSSQPRYLQLVEAILELIYTENLVAGDRLQSERVLAKKLNAAPMTVRRALAMLVEQGVLVRQPARGTFIAQTVPKMHDHDKLFGLPQFLRPPLKREVVTLRIENQDSVPNQLRFWQEAIEAYSRLNPRVKVEIVHGRTGMTGGMNCSQADVLFIPQFSVMHSLARGCIRPFAQPAKARDFLPCFAKTMDFASPFSVATNLMVVNLALATSLGIDCSGEYLDLDHVIDRMLKGGAETDLPALMAVTTLFPVSVAATDLMSTQKGQREMPRRLKPLLEKLVRIEPPVIPDMGDRPERFARGEIAIIETTTALVPSVKARARVPIRVFAPIAKRGGRCAYTPFVLTVSSSSEHPREAEDLARFFSTEEIQHLEVKHAYAVPARRHMLKGIAEERFPGVHALRQVLRKGEARGADAWKVAEYGETVCMPLCVKMLKREITVRQGLDLMVQRTKLLHNGEYGWNYRAGENNE